MTEYRSPAPAQVMGPLGEALTLDSLAPPGTRRLVVRRKAEIVAAVKGRLLTIAEVCDRYGLSPGAFALWQRTIDCSGVPGLRVTSVRHCP